MVNIEFNDTIGCCLTNESFIWRPRYRGPKLRLVDWQLSLLAADVILDHAWLAKGECL